MYRLHKFVWLAGYGRRSQCIDSADSIDGLSWGGLDEEYTYAVYLDDDCLVEFKGIDGDAVRTKLSGGL